MRSTLLFILLSSGCIGHAQYNGPESCEYDAVADRWLISNTGDNTIKQRSSGGTVTPFVSTPAAPYGLEIQGDTLFACEGGTIKGYLLSNASLVFDLDLGATFLNGITTDGHFIYTTDFNVHRIYKVDVAAQTFTTLVSNTTDTPNGIKYDPSLAKLWVAFWGSNAKVKSYDKSSGAQLSTFSTSVTNIDGITLDCLGRILISSWSPDRITRYENTFTLPAVDLGVAGLNNPADIGYDHIHNRIGIPNAGSSTVQLFEQLDCTTAVIEQPGYTTISAVPNPTDGLLHIDLKTSAQQPFMVLDARGLLVASGTLSPSGMLDISSLAPGMYLIDLARLKKYVRVVKR